MPTSPCKRRWQTYTWCLFRSMFDKERSCHPLPVKKKKAKKKKPASGSNGIQQNGRAFHHYGTPKRRRHRLSRSSFLFAEGVQQLEHLNVVVCASTWFRRALGTFFPFSFFLYSFTFQTHKTLLFI